MAVSLGCLAFGLYIERPSLAPMEGEVAYYEESRYGRIEVHQADGQQTLFLDGVPLFSSQNLTLAEETVHYPLSQLDMVNQILLISAEGGIMKEIAKYQPEQVDYVEIDPRITQVQFKFDLLKKLPSLNLIHQDGRAFLKATDKAYNAILLNVPEPDTFQLNRFYTVRFFELARNRLEPDGIFLFSVSGIDNYLSKAQRQKISSLHQTARTQFENVLMLPGDRIYFLCRNAPLSPDIPNLLAEKGIKTTYIQGYFYGNMTKSRIDRLQDEVIPDAPVNRDYAPNMIRIMFSEWFSQYASSPTLFMALIALLAGVYFILITREEFVLFSTGCLTMGSETLVIFAFQIFFGYIYYQIGLIVTVFLAGLLPGAVFGERLRRYGRQVLMITDALLIALLLFFIASVYMLGDHLPLGSFLVFGFLVSAACGCQFPVALYLRGSNQSAAIQSFSADLIGAAAGTLITSVLLIPYVGILWTAAALAGIKTASLILIRTGHDIHIQT
jgi:spermidine synthase